ncbi:MAG: CocE/NonD family hydrolase [Ilumatobacteraceae bacterium]
MVAGLVLAGCRDVAAPAATDTAATAATDPAATAPAATASTAEPATGTSTDASTDASTVDATTARIATAPWTTLPGWEQVALVDAEPGHELELTDDTGAVAGTGTVDDLGAVQFRDVSAGAYTIRDAAEPGTATAPFDVHALDEVPDRSLYDAQQLSAEGFGYLTTRDGTTLSINVSLPGPLEEGPFPTVVEYSGYEPSNPSPAVPFGLLFTTLGYAYVGINVRGTGCSGGSFSFFDAAQRLDGYDAIETVAAQPWVLDHRVGMVGVSYPGIAQLFVAATRPPSLAAITPMSVLEDSATGVMYPGGILNTGFGVNWTRQRMEEARPRGQAWAAARIDAGDATCAANQRLRLQNLDLTAQVLDNPFWTDELAAPLAPRLFVDRIDVPVFVAGAWQDEQTGGRFATMLDRFTSSPHVYASLVNGVHTESIGPGVLPRYVEFLDLYVARRVPSLDAARFAAPILSSVLFGTPQGLTAPDRFAGRTYDEALATFEGEPPIEVLFEEGAADGAPPGAPVPRWISSFESWPVPAVAGAWYLDAGETLATAPPTAGAGADRVTSYTADATAVPATFLDEPGAVWRYDVTWDWPQAPDGTAASFATVPLAADTVVIGSGSADLWLRTDAPTGDTDLEVTISELRPDGQEVYVQSGWLRVSQRALDDDASTELRPVQTHREADAAPLDAGEWVLARVELFPFAHAFRAGSRLRMTVDAPGGNRAEWVFDTIARGETVEIAHDAEHPSRLVLPVVADVDVPAGYPSCTLRGQPCRTARAEPVAQP